MREFKVHRILADDTANDVCLAPAAPFKQDLPIIDCNYLESLTAMACVTVESLYLYTFRLHLFCHAYCSVKERVLLFLVVEVTPMY